MTKNQYRIAVVGAGSLLGREIGDEISDSPLALATTILLDTEDASGTLESMGDEAAILQTMEPAALENVDVAIFADERMLREHEGTARSMGVAVVDATGTGSAAVRSPLSSDAGPLDLETSAVRTAHPVATMLALVTALAGNAATVRSVSATVLQPASESGRAALDELQQQSINLLSFQAVPTEEFGAQVAFNFLPSLGEGARHSLHAAQERIVSDLRTLRPAQPPTVVQLIQAPVFHGFAVSLFLEFEREITSDDLRHALNSEHIDLTGEDDPPSNLSSAGQGKVQICIGNAEGNRAALWLTADNLKLAARTAVACALELTRMRPIGTVQ